MLPKPGCEEILPARSSASDEARVPGGGMVERADVGGRMGRRGVRRDIERFWHGVASLAYVSIEKEKQCKQCIPLGCCYAWSEECGSAASWACSHP
jgi:hypothetical protein